MAAFSDNEWEGLSSHDKQALKAIGRVAPAGFEPLRKFAGVGQGKIASLLDKGLVEQGLSFPRNEDGFRLTDKGWLALDRCLGRRSI